MSDRTRWAIGASIFLSAYLGGYLLSRVPAAGKLGGGGGGVGMTVMSWLVPVILKKRPSAKERETQHERDRNASGRSGGEGG